MKIRPSEWEQLIVDYYRDNKTIRDAKDRWLTPKEDIMGKLPVKSDLLEDSTKAKVDKVKNARKIMGAVSKFAMNPKKKSKKSKEGSKAEEAMESKTEERSEQD